MSASWMRGMNRASFKKTLHRFLPVAFFLPWLWVPPAPAVTVEGVLKHMSDTYARVETYQTEVKEASLNEYIRSL